MKERERERERKGGIANKLLGNDVWRAKRNMFQIERPTTVGVLGARPLDPAEDSRFPFGITCLVPPQDTLLPRRKEGERDLTEHTLAEINTTKLLDKEVLGNAIDHGLFQNPPHTQLRPAELDPLLSGNSKRRFQKRSAQPPPRVTKRPAPTSRARPPPPEPALQANQPTHPLRQAEISSATTAETTTTTAASAGRGRGSRRGRAAVGDIFD